MSPEPETAAAPAWHRVLDGVEALLWLGLIVFGGMVAYTMLRGEAPPSPQQLAPAPEGLVEAEALEVLGRSREFDFWLQSTATFRGGRWSQDGHMFAFGTRQGDWIDLALPEVEPGRYRLELFLTKAGDYGIVQPALNGDPLGEELDLWSGLGVVPTGAVDLGVVDLRGKGDVLRLAVTDRNPRAAAPHFQFGLDGVRLSRQEDAAPSER